MKKCENERHLRIVAKIAKQRKFQTIHMKRLVFLLILIFKGQRSEVPKGLLGAGG